MNNIKRTHSRGETADARSNPRVSVVMGVYNGAKYLRESIESVLRQSFQDFEFLIIDDASTDSTPEILREYALEDKRVRLLENETNLGLTKSLNRGLQVARSEFIARQDADDVSDPHRLEIQLRFMDTHPEVGLLGTGYDTIDDEGNVLQRGRPPQSDTAIRWQMLFHNAFCHSSVILRRSILSKEGLSYDESLPYSQDVELWTRVLQHTAAANLNEPLVYLRRHSGNVSSMHGEEQTRLATMVAWGQMRDLLGENSPSETQVPTFRRFFQEIPNPMHADDLRICVRILRLLNLFSRQCGPDSRTVREIRLSWAIRILKAAPPRLYPRLLSSSAIACLLRYDALYVSLGAAREVVRCLWRKLIGALR